MSKTFRLILMFTGIIFFSSLIYFALNSTNDSQTIEMIHYTEFEGQVFTENWCTENLSCHGFDKNGEKIILDCGDRIMHGCGPDNFDDYDIQNETSTFDFEIEYDGGTYGNQYEISGATVNEITYDPEANSLSISLNESKNGYIHIVIPLELFDGMHVDLESSDPFTLIDGEEVAYEQLSPNQLKINFEKGDKLIEIIGTYQI